MAYIRLQTSFPGLQIRIWHSVSLFSMMGLLDLNGYLVEVLGWLRGGLGIATIGLSVYHEMLIYMI